jgi:deoxyribonuclease-4
MRLGAQMSSAGGLFRVFARGHEVGCESIMMFTKSNRQWNANELTTEQIEAFREAANDHDRVWPVAVHASYLINLASPDGELWERSVAALVEEVRRAGLLGIPTVTFHPGAAVDGDEEGGLARIAKGVSRVLQETMDVAPHTALCLETMAGQGSQLGHRFGHLAAIIEQAAPDDDVQERLRVCMDTCHIFAAGYDIRTPEGYEVVMAEFDEVVGLERIACFHLNDSVHPLGSRKDRHAHIGEGELGLAPFAAFLNDPRWASHPGHLETPKVLKIPPKTKRGKTKEVDMDPVNLKTLRGLVTTSHTGRRRSRKKRPKVRL